MPEFEESRLCFSFGNQWSVEAYDQHKDFLNLFQNLQGTKAIDFLGLYGGSIYFIEVKNYSGHISQNVQKIKGGELKNDLVHKFRDTTLWILLAHHRYERQTWANYAESIGNSNSEIRFVAWIELGFDQSQYRVKKLKTHWSTLQNQLKQAFGGVMKFDKKIFFVVTSSNFQSGTVPDLTVQVVS